MIAVDAYSQIYIQKRWFIAIHSFNVYVYGDGSIYNNRYICNVYAFPKGFSLFELLHIYYRVLLNGSNVARFHISNRMHKSVWQSLLYNNTILTESDN